jgi:carboxyl-terminal processing protease
VLNDSDSKLAWDGPLVVAVGKLSASASEIVAGALQDYGRAVIVGDQSTHGKGTVQQVIALETLPHMQVANPGKLKLTVSKFYRVSGSTTQKQGVTPDVILPSIYDYLDIGEAALENCLPADQTTPAKFNPFDQVKEHLDALHAASKARVEQSKDFAYLLEDIEQVKKRKDEKTISLNEKVRLAERDQDKARAEGRKKERAARTKSSSHIFELDLEMVEKNKPLEPFDPNKGKEEADLAQATPPTGDTADAEDAEAEADPLVDPHLDETLEITRHYLTLLGKGTKPGVALKKD